MNDPHRPPPDQPQQGRYGRQQQPADGQQQPGPPYPPQSPQPPASGQQQPNPYGRSRGRHARPAQQPPPPQQPGPGPYTHEQQQPAYTQQPHFQPPAPYPQPGPHQYAPEQQQHAFGQHTPYPPPVGRPDGQDDPNRTNPENPEGDGTSSNPRRSRMGPRTRRVVEACALAVLLPSLLGLYWVDETGRAEDLEPSVKVSSVARGKIGELAGARMTVYKRESAPRPGAPEGQDVVQLQVILAVKAQDAESAETIGGYGVEYRFVGGQGLEWTANASKPTRIQPGKAFPLTVRGTVPRAKAESLALEVRLPETARKGAAPLPSLRFEP